MREVEMITEREAALPAEEKRPWADPEISEPRTLIGNPNSLILQAASGSTDSGGPGNLDGPLDP